MSNEDKITNENTPNTTIEPPNETPTDENNTTPNNDLTTITEQDNFTENYDMTIDESDDSSNTTKYTPDTKALIDIINDLSKMILLERKNNEFIRETAETECRTWASTIAALQKKNPPSKQIRTNFN